MDDVIKCKYGVPMKLLFYEVTYITILLPCAKFMFKALTEFIFKKN